MKIRLSIAFLLPLSALFAGSLPVGAQQLPPPAPRPTTASPAKKPATSPTPASTASPESARGEEPSYYAPDEAPLQMQPTATPTTKPTAKPAAKPTPKATARPKPVAKVLPLSIGGVSIRGLNDYAAIVKLKKAHQAKLNDSMTLWDGEKKHLMNRAKLGATIPYYALLHEARRLKSGDVPLRFTVDLAKAQRAMRLLAPQINRKSEFASLDVVNGQVVARGGQSAELAILGSAQRIREALQAQPPQTYIELVVARNGAASDLAQFRYLLASFSTPYDSSIRGRTNNLKMAAHEINGTIVKAGAIFSTNRAIGPRNAAAGWREAKMFVNGQIVSGTGAGICQSSTTLYNAALLAGLPIVERHQHTFRVNYAPASRDAAIAWGSKDFRFKNTTDGPLYVQTFLRGERFHVRLYGTQPAPDGIEIQSQILSRKNGQRSEAYRVWRDGDKAKKELLSRDYYKPHP